jgi:hypothetical protein
MKGCLPGRFTGVKALDFPCVARLRWRHAGVWSCVGWTQSQFCDFLFSRDNSLFRETDSLFREKDSLFRCVGNWAASH